jgi:hypothetical protein
MSWNQTPPSPLNFVSLRGYAEAKPPLGFELRSLFLGTPKVLIHPLRVFVILD